MYQTVNENIFTLLKSILDMFPLHRLVRAKGRFQICTILSKSISGVTLRLLPATWAAHCHCPPRHRHHCATSSCACAQSSSSETLRHKSCTEKTGNETLTFRQTRRLFVCIQRPIIYLSCCWSAAKGQRP